MKDEERERNFETFLNKNFPNSKCREINAFRRCFYGGHISALKSEREREREKVELIVRKAFNAGQRWGITYSGWFQPTKEDTEKKIQAALAEIEKGV